MILNELEVSKVQVQVKVNYTHIYMYVDTAYYGSTDD